jgi:transcription termination/antitermination protein NusG
LPAVDGVSSGSDPRTGAAAGHDGPQWYALWTASHCERLVLDQLVAKGFELFLPALDVWSRRRGTRRLINSPMFPGYLFLRHAMDKGAYVEIRKTRGLVRILGERWDRLAVVADGEIDAIQRLMGLDLRLFPHPYLREGQRVRITDGPLTGVQGLLVRANPDKGLLVLSITLLQRSVAVSVDCTHVACIN